MADKPNLPKLLKLEKGFPCYKPLAKMGVKAGEEVILTNPGEVLPIMNTVPKGRLITIVEICKKLAKKHRVAGCCTLTTGIFIMTAANAAKETGGRLPYWRTLKGDGSLNEKFPGGAISQKRLLEREGFRIIKKGKRYLVHDFEKCLIR